MHIGADGARGEVVLWHAVQVLPLDKECAILQKKVENRALEMLQKQRLAHWIPAHVSIGSGVETVKQERWSVIINLNTQPIHYFHTPTRIL